MTPSPGLMSRFYGDWLSPVSRFAFIRRKSGCFPGSELISSRNSQLLASPFCQNVLLRAHTNVPIRFPFRLLAKLLWGYRQ